MIRNIRRLLNAARASETFIVFVRTSYDVPVLSAALAEQYELRRFVDWLLAHEGITGLVANGHAGEVFVLSLREQGIVADQASGRASVVSASPAKASNEAVEHTHAFVEAGAAGALVMPPHTERPTPVNTLPKR